MIVKELKNLLKNKNDNLRVCIRLENDDLMSIYGEVVQIAVAEAHFDNQYGNEEWGKFLYFTT